MKTILTICLSLLTMASIGAQTSESPVGAAQHVRQQTSETVLPPADLWTDVFTMEYTLSDVSGESQGQSLVNVGIYDGYCDLYKHIYSGTIYMQGLCPQLPEAWVKAAIANEILEYGVMPGSIEVYAQLRISLPQYLGHDEQQGDLYLTAFDPTTGESLSEVDMEYRPFYNTINNLSAPLCIGNSPTEKSSIMEYTSLSLQFDVKVIEDSPAGTEFVYSRSGGVVKEVEKLPGNEDNPYEITYATQTGTINIVFGADNKVYLQQPISEMTYYSGWVEGTLSEDGKTITVPTGQYLSYTRSFNMGVQMWMCRYDESLQSFVADRSIQEVTYTIDNGEIRLNGSSTTCGLGCVNRAFGLVYTYLNGEWLQTCDYESVYTPFDEEPLEAPDDLLTDTYHLTTCYFIAEWSPLDVDVEIGFNDDEVWLKGISLYLPDAWIKGWRDGDKLVFPSEQYLGSASGVPVYFKDVRLENGNTVVKDMELIFDGTDTYTTTDYIFIVTAKGTLEYLNYYMGATISKHTDELVEVPEGITTSFYTFSYETVLDEEGTRVEAHHRVHVGYDGNDVYIRGLWEGLPDAWVKGTLTADNLLVLSLPQYMGVYTDEYLGAYPIYLTAFDEQTDELLPELTFCYKRYGSNGGTVHFDQPSLPISIGICKTGYLGLQDFYEQVIANGEPTGIGNNYQYATTNTHSALYDLQGRRVVGGTSLVNSGPCQKGVRIMRMDDGAVRKVMVK